jgi:hypothetical protein
MSWHLGVKLILDIAWSFNPWIYLFETEFKFPESSLCWRSVRRPPDLTPLTQSPLNSSGLLDPIIARIEIQRVEEKRIGIILHCKTICELVTDSDRRKKAIDGEASVLIPKGE